MDFTAEWIWGGHQPSPRNEWRLFRKVFQMARESDRAIIRITADTRYVLYVNGHQVGRGPVRSFAFEQSFDEYDVSQFLMRDASNVIVVLVQHFGVSTFAYPYGPDGRAGLLLQCDLFQGQERIDSVGTDSSWDTAHFPGYERRAPRLSLQLGFAEMLDAREFPKDWNNIPAPSRDRQIPWEPAQVIGPVGMLPWATLVPRDIPMLTEEVIYPRAVTSLKSVVSASFTTTLNLRNQFDRASVYHQNLIGYVGYAGTVIRLDRDAKVTVGLMAGALTIRRIILDGISHDVADMDGEPPQAFCTETLCAGDHLLLLDANGYDHGRNPQLLLDTTANLELLSPLLFLDDQNNSDEELKPVTPFVSVGPFQLQIHMDSPTGTTALDDSHLTYQAVSSVSHVGELASYREFIHSFDPFCVSPSSVFADSVWQREAKAYPVPVSLQHLAIANAESTELPMYPLCDTQIVIDFGKEYSGFIQFDVDASAGTTLDFYGYEYERDGWRQETFDLENTFRYTCREGRQVYQSPSRRGFRYLMMTVRGATRSPKVYGVQVVQSNFPVAEVGQFASSDVLLNQIYDISRHTTRVCMEDTFVDCPAYEQTFWVGDSRNEALVNYMVFGANDIVRRGLRLVTRSARQTKYLCNQVPSGWVSVIPNWTFLWAIACEEYLFRTQDDDFLREVFPALAGAMDEFATHLDEDGLLNIEAWNLLDWAPIDQPNEGVVTHQNAFFVRALRVASQMAETLGEVKLRDRYSQIASSLAAAVNAHLWCAERQAYYDCIHSDGTVSENFSMQTQIVAYICDVPDAPKRSVIEHHIQSPPKGFVLIGSPFMSFFYYEALAKMGQGMESRIVDDIRIHYGQMIEHGATTCWEMYPNFTENRANPKFLTRSHCHAWSAGPGYFLPRHVLGVSPTSPGWACVSVEPCRGNLEWARGSVPLPNGGRIDVSWNMQAENHMTLEVVAPPGVEVTARLPKGMQGTVRVTAV